MKRYEPVIVKSENCQMINLIECNNGRFILYDDMKDNLKNRVMVDINELNELISSVEKLKKIVADI